jgi:hypothetical protein
MRQIKPYVDFNDAMQRIERDMALRLVKIAHAQRGKMAAALVSSGIRSPQVSKAVTEIAGNTARLAGEEIVVTFPVIDRHLHTMLDAVLREDERPFIPDGTLADTAARRAMTMDLTGAWGRIFAGKLLQAVFRLQANAKTTTGEAVDQLLGEVDPLGVAANPSIWAKSAGELVLWANDAFWDDVNGTTAETYGLVAAGTEKQYYKQWVSGIDERTTETCLILNGAVVPLEEPFQVTGTPRFADEVDGPPGHWNCRSALALIREDELGDELTQRMAAARDTEAERRKGLGPGDRSRELRLAQSGGRARHSILTGVGGNARGEAIWRTKRIYRRPGSGVEQGGVTGVDMYEHFHVVKKKP